MAEPSARTAVDQRIQALEHVTTTLTAESRATRNDVERLAGAFDGFAGEVRRWMQSSGRPNYGWMIAFGAFLVTIAGVAAAPFLRDLSRMEAHQAEVDRALDTIAATRWTRTDHDAYQLRLDSRLRDLETRLASRVETEALARRVDELREDLRAERRDE